MPGADRERDEKQIIDYIAYEGFFANHGKGWAPSAIRSNIAAIRFMHTCNYYPDPVVGNPRIRATFKALDMQVREPVQVKWPATKEVVTSAMRRVTQCRSYPEKDKETVNADPSPCRPSP